MDFASSLLNQQGYLFKKQGVTSWSVYKVTAVLLLENNTDLS